MEPITAFETGTPEGIDYKRGTTFVRLEGFNAWLYRQMIWRYGESEATEKFWWLWHKKDA